MIGIRSTANKAADQAFTSNVTLASVGLSTPIAASQKKIIRWIVFVSVGATGGVRLQVVVPAGGTLFNVAIKLYNTVAPSLTTAFQTSSAAFTNALANAGSHWIEIEAEIENGTTAGTVDLQMAQNTSDPLTLTVKAGSNGQFESVA